MTLFRVQIWSLSLKVTMYMGISMRLDERHLLILLCRYYEECHPLKTFRMIYSFLTFFDHHLSTWLKADATTAKEWFKRRFFYACFLYWWLKNVYGIELGEPTFLDLYRSHTECKPRSKLSGGSYDLNIWRASVESSGRKCVIKY